MHAGAGRRLHVQELAVDDLGRLLALHRAAVVLGHVEGPVFVSFGARCVGLVAAQQDVPLRALRLVVGQEMVEHGGDIGALAGLADGGQAVAGDALGVGPLDAVEAFAGRRRGAARRVGADAARHALAAGRDLRAAARARRPLAGQFTRLLRQAALAAAAADLRVAVETARVEPRPAKAAFCFRGERIALRGGDVLLEEIARVRGALLALGAVVFTAAAAALRLPAVARALGFLGAPRHDRQHAHAALVPAFLACGRRGCFRRGGAAGVVSSRAPN